MTKEHRQYCDNRKLDKAIESGEVIIDKENIAETVYSVLKWADTHPDEHKLSLCANWFFVRMPDFLNYCSSRHINFVDVMQKIFKNN